MLLVLVKGLVLCSGSHGERCLSGSNAAYSDATYSCPETLCTLWSCPTRGKDGSRFASVLHTASGLFLTAKSLRGALKQPRGLASLRYAAFASGYNQRFPRRSFAPPPGLQRQTSRLASSHPQKRPRGTARGSARGQRPFLQRQTAPHSTSEAPNFIPATRPWVPTNQDSL